MLSVDATSPILLRLVSRLDGDAWQRLAKSTVDPRRKDRDRRTLTQAETPMNQKPRSQGFIIPIVRSSQLWLAPFDGDGRRFASAFKETWKLIPISDRKTMNRRWARQREQFHDHATPIPQIELMRSKSDWGRGPSGNALAQFIPVPFDTLSFCSTAADVMPGALLYAFIAHELAHVYLLAINHESHAPDIGDSWKEQAVYDLLTERWGFDDMACDEWIAGHLQEQEQENEHNGKLGPPPPSK